MDKIIHKIIQTNASQPMRCGDRSLGPIQTLAAPPGAALLLRWRFCPLIARSLRLAGPDVQGLELSGVPRRILLFMHPSPLRELLQSGMLRFKQVINSRVAEQRASPSLGLPPCFRCHCFYCGLGGYAVWSRSLGTVRLFGLRWFNSRVSVPRNPRCGNLCLFSLIFPESLEY